jgi:hypothetical protein
MTENCGSCKFYRDRDIRGGVMSGHGTCLRYPEAIKTNDGRWCGEHVAVEARDPEAVYRKLQRVLVQSPVASQERSGGKPSDHRGDDVHPVETGINTLDPFVDMLEHASSVGQKPTRWIVGSHVIDAVRLATGHSPAEEGSTDINELFGIPMEQSVDLSRGRVTLRCGAWPAGAFTIDTNDKKGS